MNLLNVLFVAINSKYVHTNLAVRYLKEACCGEARVEILEKSINTDKNLVLKQIYLKNPELVCFSCYIWNIDYVLEISQNLKKVLPNIQILLGGPQVSFDSVRVMDESPFIDFVISGEGERSVAELVGCIKGGLDCGDVDGLTFRRGSEIVQNRQRDLIKDMGSIASPYLDIDKAEYEGRIIYYESSRGCPFNCQYCMSSTTRGVRHFPIERVKSELKAFIDSNVKQVKFVDRTFNSDASRTVEIIEFIKENDNGLTNFHFEVAAHIMDSKIINALSNSRRGLFQVEIGVQSTNCKTLEAICRRQDFERIRHVVESLSRGGNVHQHVDLIAGLPHEGYDSFKKSFDDVFSLGADHVQLGFLKLLKGSPIREKQLNVHGYEFSENPPYEVLKNDYIDFGELLKLKEIEEVLELYWNSHGFSKSCGYLIETHYKSPFAFFEGFSSYWRANGYFEIGHSRNALYKIMAEFYEKEIGKNVELFKEILRYDYVAFAKGQSPKFLGSSNVKGFKARCHQFVSDSENFLKYMGMYEGLDVGTVMRKITIEAFSHDLESLFVDMNCEPIKKDSFALCIYEEAESLTERSLVHFIDL